VRVPAAPDLGFQNPMTQIDTEDPCHFTGAMMVDYFKNKYPKLFGDDLISFDCGDGWKDIIDRLLAKIYDEAIKIDTHVVQVKEKFGGLRVYLGRENEFISEAIRAAEKEAINTCEHCVAKEKITTEGGWLKTLCGQCHESRFKKP